jgi:endoglucanase
MSIKNEEFLFKLLNTPSPVGFELEGQRVWVEEMKKYCFSAYVDTHQNALASLSGVGESHRTVMLASHADEIGYTVTHVTDDGYIHIGRLGGSDPEIARGKRVTIITDSSKVDGVIVNLAIHMKTEYKKPKWEDMLVDVGASDKKEVNELGIRVGCPIVLADGPKWLNENRLISRAIDNKISGYMISRVFQNLYELDKALPHNVCGLNAVMEEIGGGGAAIGTFKVRPDVAICLDVCHATDTPGVNKAIHGDVKMGEGPTVTHGSINNREIVKMLIDIADDLDIPLQHETISSCSGTDTDSIFMTRSGVPAALVSVPVRYMHSPIEQVDVRDIENCITLLTEYCKRCFK